MVRIASLKNRTVVLIIASRKIVPCAAPIHLTWVVCHKAPVRVE